MTNKPTATTDQTEYVWDVSWLDQPLSNDDKPPTDARDLVPAVIAWFLDQNPKWINTDDDRNAIVWLAECLRHNRPCMALRGPRDGDTGWPRLDTTTAMGVISLPRRIRTATGATDRVTQSLTVVRRDRPPEQSRVQDHTGRTPVPGGPETLVKAAEHLMTDLPEFSDIIRAVMIETTVAGSS